jgi:3-oxoacyl-[acyl-carrier protein] reductase
MKIELSGKIALVTGGSRGIGAAVVRTLAEAGADIAFTYIVHKKEAEAVRQSVERMGRACIFIKAAVDEQIQVRKAVRQTVKMFRRIDILVNNAGVWRYGEIGAMTERQWDETLDVNLKGIFLFCNEVVPLMKRQGGGKIINISSTAGQRGEPFHSHYAASKGGIIAFTKSLGPELAPFNISVNCVAPGWVETDMTRSDLCDPKSGEEIKRVIPRGRVAEPREIAGSVLFLASELSEHLIGSIISVNGGSVLSN